ncbi:DUF4435 domain-containing protein [Micrococcus sp. TA1]|uniref:DUF4435 domain-containing protein n=1 Tax=Micrococcus sp. TA1 TaxID=681627 RepID=UPI00160C2F8B|nr:DUF4435 domain-containing protein [Micrococcus sp. TA1]MBB5748037.1 hypothetical protein [Micrococcus sp. TA1]
MREYLNENTLFNTVAMTLGVSSQLLLIVEGPDDHLLLKRFTTSHLRLLAATGGREQVLGAARLAQSRGLKRSGYLVDRDYDDFTGETSTQLDNVFVSDHHDCFVDLLAVDPKLLKWVIDVHTASARRRGGNARPVPDVEVIEAEAFTLASFLSAVRIVDAMRSLNLDFKRFSFGGLKVNEFDVSKIAHIVLSRSRYSAEDYELIVSEATRMHAHISGLPHLPVGDHDLFEALAKVLSRYGVKVSDDNLQRGYILAATYNTVSGTGWFREIQMWCGEFGKRGFGDDLNSQVA